MSDGYPYQGVVLEVVKEGEYPLRGEWPAPNVYSLFFESYVVRGTKTRSEGGTFGVKRLYWVNPDQLIW